ncbi:OmpA family protein [Bacteroidota bacterium]
MAQKNPDATVNNIRFTTLDILNSPYRETNPCLTPDGKYIFFLSGRGGMAWSDPEYTYYKGKYEPDGDLYYSRKINEIWSEPVNLGPSVNTDMGEDEPNVTPDGQYVYYQSWKEGWDKDGGPYYISELFGKVWGKPKGLGSGIHKFFLYQIEKNDWMYATDGSSITPDGNIFVFAAGKYYDQPMDLYISRKNGEQWSYPVKLAVSTKRGDERSVFIAGDNRTLFFSSSGYRGLGKLDIYKTIIFDNNQCGDVINLGSDFNSPENDFGFTMNASGEEIFFTRNGEIIFAEVEKPGEILQPFPTLIISGFVNDYYGNPVESKIEITRKQDQKVIAKAKSNRVSGEYSMIIQKTKGKYIKSIKSDNYRPYINEFEVIDVDMAEEITEHVLLKEFNTELIFFELNDSTIKEDESLKIDSVVTYLFRNKNKRVLLSGHTDQSGTDEYNLELSEKRARKVKNYMVENGIPDFIIKTRHFGESKPIKILPYEGELYINRRVEIKIVENSIDDD